jgi:transposase
MFGDTVVSSIPVWQYAFSMLSSLSCRLLLNQKAMANVVTFEQINAHAAAIDIGAEKIFVSPDGQQVWIYQTFTADYRRCVQDLKDHGIRSVCMEATGVYWIALYELLEQAGIEVCLVNPKEVKQVKGRKSDPKDCRWIQKVFSAGLVRQSYVPAGMLKELRMMVREREDVIICGSSYVNKMQKALELMNIKLTNVLSQIHGASGIRIIEAIIGGERDPQQLLLLCDSRIVEQKAEQVLKALEGNYNESWIFLLNQGLVMWKMHQQQIIVMDNKIASLLDKLEKGKAFVKSVGKIKPIRHHAPKIKDLHQKMLNIYGVDGSSLSGITDYTLLRLLGEVGTDMSRFATVKHFVSWCQLAPVLHQSGRMNKRIKIRSGSKAGQIFREIAQALISSKHIAIGAFMRRIRYRKDSKIAIKAGARKLAEAFYRLLTKGKDYVERGVINYTKQLEEKEKKFLEKLASKHNLKLVTV